MKFIPKNYFPFENILKIVPLIKSVCYIIFQCASVGIQIKAAMRPVVLLRRAE